MTNEELYKYTKANPTKENIQKFIDGHRPYIFGIVLRYLKNQHADIEEVASQVFLLLLQRSHLDFSRSYFEVKGYMGLTAQRVCQRFLTNKYLRHEQNNVDDWKWNKMPEEKYDNKNLQIVEELKKYCNPRELKIFEGYLDGDLGVNISEKMGFSRQYVHQILYRFGKRNMHHYKRIKEKLL